MTTEPTAMIVSVNGRVQGVSYRAWTKKEAEARGLAGWVRNEADGSVSALIEGPPDAVDDMIEALGKGPLPARVDDVTAMPGAETGASGFNIVEDDA